MFNLVHIQNLLNKSQLDGWLFSDFQGRDYISQSFLSLLDKTKSTRRLFYYIPAHGEPIKILSAIEPLLLDHLPGVKWLYSGKNDLHNKLSLVLKNGHNVACQYSKNGNVPTISTMDSGLMEYLLDFGIHPVSSADLLQYVGATLSDTQVASHQEAGIITHEILTQSFAWIRDNLRKGIVIDEFGYLQELNRLIAQYPIHMDSPPFFGIDEHACDPGYEPCINGSKKIVDGSRLIIDFANRLHKDDAIYYDVSWCIQVGDKADPEYLRLFDFIYQGREKARKYIENELAQGRLARGCDVDALVLEHFKEHHLEQYRKHRTGHNIGHLCHGIGANLDDFETHDTRLLIPNTMFSIEPGVYTEKYGVRLEYDVHLTNERELKIYGPIQDQLLYI